MNATLSRKSTSDRETRKSGEPCAAFLSHEEGNHSVLRQDRFICCPEIHVQADSLCQHLSAHFSKTGTFEVSQLVSLKTVVVIMDQGHFLVVGRLHYILFIN